MDFTSARLNMVESQVRTNDVTDLGVQEAMRAIPRERFVLPARAALAYADTEVEYAPGHWLMRPRDVAKLLHAAHALAGERALAIAAPYAAAVLARMGLTVTALEPVESDAHAREALNGEGVTVAAGDLSRVDGVYDLIICEAALAQVPAAWLEALAAGGRLATVLRQGPAGKATIHVQAGSAFGAREVFDSSPPYLPRFEPRAAFVF